MSAFLYSRVNFIQKGASINKKATKITIEYIPKPTTENTIANAEASKAVTDTTMLSMNIDMAVIASLFA